MTNIITYEAAPNDETRVDGPLIQTNTSHNVVLLERKTKISSSDQQALNNILRLARALPRILR